MSNLRNNLFFYATKELSQDAFICWLCSYTLEDADKSDEHLVECANQMVYEFMKGGTGESIDQSEMHLVSVEKQVNNIDVLLTVKYKEDTYKIIVEDKTHTSEHDNQLERYRKQMSGTNYKVIGIYYKTGFQSDKKSVAEADYIFFGRDKILNILRDCKSENAILKNYREYWEDFEEVTQSYKTLPIGEWKDWMAVNGFYDEMKTVLEDKGVWAGYDYVSNRSGGFWGLWYGLNDDRIEDGDVKAIIYLQVETKWDDDSSKYELRICTKLENQSDDKRDESILILKDLIIKKQEDYGFTKPNRLRKGTYMTVGEYKDVEKSTTYEDLKRNILESVDQYRSLIERVREDYLYTQKEEQA